MQDAHTSYKTHVVSVSFICAAIRVTKPCPIGLSFSATIDREDRDHAFSLLDAYIERESEVGERIDYDRVRGLVPHMRKRWWKASSNDQA